ncbi:MAG: VOC family protein [candidate division Zixibacteria bacterium]|nr:VOC family protein [candidate division Zixibacteria bacterium]
MGQPVVHFEISSKDYKKAHDFYQNLFGWTIKEFGGMPYGLVDAEGDNSIGGGITETKDDTPPSVTFYIQVDDLQAYLDKAESLGGKTVVPPSPIPNVGSFAMFSDIDGNVIGLFKSNE